MFKELAPYLRQRAVLLTVTHLDEDQIRVNVIPQKIKDGENSALTTPLSVTGTAEELDRDLPATIVDFVSAHMHLKNSLDRAKEEMDAARKPPRPKPERSRRGPGRKNRRRRTRTKQRPRRSSPSPLSRSRQRRQAFSMCRLRPAPLLWLRCVTRKRRFSLKSKMAR